MQTFSQHSSLLIFLAATWVSQSKPCFAQYFTVLHYHAIVANQKKPDVMCFVLFHFILRLLKGKAIEQQPRACMHHQYHQYSYISESLNLCSLASLLPTKALLNQSRITMPREELYEAIRFLFAMKQSVGCTSPLLFSSAGSSFSRAWACNGARPISNIPQPFAVAIHRGEVENSVKEGVTGRRVGVKAGVMGASQRAAAAAAAEAS